MTGASQACWMCLDRSEGPVVLARQLHVVLILDTADSSAPATEADRMASWKGAWLQLKPERLKVPACTCCSFQVPQCELAATPVSTVYQRVGRSELLYQVRSSAPCRTIAGEDCWHAERSARYIAASASLLSSLTGRQRHETEVLKTV